jgi:hypothetical protein
MTAVPELPDNHHIPVSDYARQLSAFFKVYDYAKRLEYMGGEPLMHPDIIAIIEETLKYRNYFQDLRITTNGTIVPSDELCALIADCGVYFDFIVDDYGELSPKLPQVCERLKSYGIPYRIDKYCGEEQHFNGWVKLGDYEYIDYTDEQLLENHHNCVQIKDAFACYYEGKVFQCPYPLRFYIIKGVTPNKIDYIDLFDEETPISEKREIASGFYKTPMKACHCCNGFSEQKSARYPAAKQRL